MLLSSALNLTLPGCCRSFLEKPFASLQGDLHLCTKELFNFLSRPPREPLCPHTMLTTGWLSEGSALIYFFFLNLLHVFLTVPISSSLAFPQKPLPRILEPSIDCYHKLTPAVCGAHSGCSPQLCAATVI